MVKQWESHRRKTTLFATSEGWVILIYFKDDGNELVDVMRK